MAFGQVVPAERIALYVRALSDLTDKQLTQGFTQALRFFKPEFGKTFPLPGEIREWALYITTESDIASRALLERGDKPPDWEPDFAKIVVREMAQLVAEGHYDMPKPKREDFDEGYGTHAEHLAAKRNGESVIPDDPHQRRIWARQKAKEQGWL